MTMPQKQCPQCGTVAPLDATFCGQCGRQYRTQFAPPAGGVPNVAPAPIYATPPPNFAARPPSVWMTRAVQGGVAALVCVGILSFSGVFRHDGKGNVPVVTSATSTQQSAAPSDAQSVAVRRALSDDPIEAAARREVDRESQRLNLPPPVSADGKVHLRSGGTISQKDWDDATRKVRESPVVRQPPPPTPF